MYSQYTYNKQIYVPYLKVGNRFVQPKYASIGEQEEYNTSKQCEKRVKKLNGQKIHS